MYAYARSNPVAFADPTGLVPNVAEASCFLDPLQPVCWVGVIADIGTTVAGSVVAAGVASIPGDTSSSNVIPFPGTKAKAPAKNCPNNDDGGCEHAQKALLARQLRLQNLKSTGFISGIQYAAAAKLYNASAQIHNDGCPGYQVSYLPLS